MIGANINIAIGNLLYDRLPLEIIVPVVVVGVLLIILLLLIVIIVLGVQRRKQQSIQLHFQMIDRDERYKYIPYFAKKTS